MDTNSLKEIIASGTVELRQVEGELKHCETLKTKKKQLLAFIAHAKALLDLATKDQAVEPRPIATSRDHQAEFRVEATLVPDPIAIPITDRSVGEDHPAPSLVAAVKQGQPLWSLACAVLALIQRPATAPEIARALQSAGQPMTENAAEIVRTAMARRTNVFERVGTGFYALVSWPDEWKRRGLSPNGAMRMDGGVEEGETATS